MLPTRLLYVRGVMLLAVVLSAAGCGRFTDDADTRAAQARIEADVRHLADDAMEGREAGTRGHDRAAAYMAARFRQLGLEPAGDDGDYLQRVPLLRAVRGREGAALVLHRDGREHAFAFADEFLPAPDFNRAASSVTAPAVFVGQGVQAPEAGHDDFSGLDVRGRVAVVLGGAPARLGADARAFHGSLRRKLELLVAQGAVGAVLVNTRGDETQRPWASVAGAWERPGLRLRCTTRQCGHVGGAIDGFPKLRAVMTVSARAAPRVFAGSGHDYDALLAAADAGTLHGFVLPGTVTLGSRTGISPLASPNVVARLPGRGPRAAEHIVVTAHLDHVGRGMPVHGDAIYNGALDNALGVAVMLETARELARATPAPARSVLFVATTAEEAGLLGAEWFVRHPPAPRGMLVANLNLDMPVLLAPSEDVVPIGIAHSSLQGEVQAAAREVGVALSPDPAPEQSAFVRSDQYPFVRAGIPAVYLAGGVDGAGWGHDPAGAARLFLRERYHQPGDDATQSIHYPDAVRLARLNARIAARIATNAQQPRWNRGDFFGERFGPHAVVPSGQPAHAAEAKPGRPPAPPR